MRTIIKIILCIAVLLLIILIYTLKWENKSIFGPIYWIVATPVAFAAWKAIWSYNTDTKKDNLSGLQKKDDGDKHILKED